MGTVPQGDSLSGAEALSPAILSLHVNSLPLGSRVPITKQQRPASKSLKALNPFLVSLFVDLMSLYLGKTTSCPS